MKYKFPTIAHIDDVLPYVRGRTDFSVSEKDDHIIICYNHVSNETFPKVDGLEGAILRECRGITFDKETGKVLSRKLHKFFNLGEREETLPVNVDLLQPHIRMEKLDGSAIHPVLHGKFLRWHTKKGLSDTARRAEVFVARHPKYAAFARAMLGIGYTPIFEWCSRKDQIVIDYPEDNLVLLHLRDLHDGHYVLRRGLEELAAKYDIPTVNVYSWQSIETSALIADTASKEGVEGFIIQFDDGHMLKVKSEWYCNLHRAVSSLVWEYNIVNLILDEKIDDFKAVLTLHGHALAEELDDYLKSFWGAFEQEVALAVNAFNVIYVTTDAGDRKAFAEKANTAGHFIRPVLFRMLDSLEGERVDTSGIFADMVRKNAVSASKWQNFKSKTKFQNVKWKYNARV